MIVEAAPAKLNLNLQIVGRRADGFHLLDSLVAFSDIGDVLTVEAGEDVSLVIDGPFAHGLSAGSDNLVLRAAMALKEASGTKAGAALRLTKHLPVASGIGGGSADAAAALRAVSRLWQLDLPLAAMAARLGADVPACLASQTCWMAGIGEVLEPCAVLPDAGLVLANPGIGLATPSVFKRRGGPFTAARRFGIPTTVAEFARELGRASNDLAAAAQELVPEIQILLGHLGALPGVRLTRMSGSGATCFALFDSREAALRAAKALELQVPAGWWVAAGGWHNPPPSAVVRHVP
jgi:4-diphosphocytidyl-2-C-methyl-D-erythritol kinase